MFVSGLFRYVIKSCAGESLSTANVGPRGIEHDHEFMVVEEETGMFVAQRRDHRRHLGIEVKSMCKVRPRVGEAFLTVTAPGMARGLTHSTWGKEKIQVQIWEDKLDAYDMGDEFAKWFSEFLSRERKGNYRLVRFPPDAQRLSTQGNALISFQDGYQWLVISDSSHADLNRRIGTETVPMVNFRPTMTVGDCDAYAEDHTKIFRLRGEHGRFYFTGETLCVRCPTTMTDQQTAVRGKEPLTTLNTYKPSPYGKGVVFGRNFNSQEGVVCLNDTIEVLQQD